MMVLSRWINRQVQVIGLRLSGDMNVAIMIYYLLMFPGIILHGGQPLPDGAVAGHAGGQLCLGAEETPECHRSAP